ncbi:MAG: LytR C-terminal domain-containing protein [Desulfotignum sp.]|nr:LytR C-terminal domain-containing protein [Desulfotignum sp.]
MSADVYVYYTIQLGVFYELDKAMAALKHARENGLDAPYVTKVDRRGPYQPYYRVRAGKYQDRDQAARRAAGIRTETPMPAYITQVAGTPEETDIIAESQVAGIQAKPVIIQSNADIEILNGNGVRHMARECRQYLTKQGIFVGRIANAAHFFHPRTVIYYSPGYYGQAKEILERFHAINADGKLIKSGTLNNGIRIVLGRDMVRSADQLGHLMKRQPPRA